MEITEQEWIYRIALSNLPGIGPVQARSLLDEFETATNIFQQKIRTLSSVDGIGVHTAKKITEHKNFDDAEADVHFIKKHNITPYFIKDENYPKRLLHCYDAPTLLFYKGNCDLNASRMICIIGTRKNTDYGRQVTEMMVEKLAAYNVAIVSGLAFGIDAIAHKASLQNHIPTIGVLAHGLNHMYPTQHRSLAKEMVQHGGLLTEFSKNVTADKYNFPDEIE
jgi:DNA processing protein